MKRFRAAIEALSAYTPGEQPALGTRIIKLNTNENPYPPSPNVIEALRKIGGEELRRYPHPFAEEFRQSAAEILSVEPSWILVGNGSDDLLTMLMRAVAGPGRTVAYPVPTYVLYRTLAAIQEAPVVEVPFDEAYGLPVSALADADPALTLVANPNSPSGTCASINRLADLAVRLKGILVIDEAYVEFADAHALELVRKFDHVVVLRTLSKSHSLAGLRLGFGIANPALIHKLAKVKDSYNVDAIASHVAAWAIRDTAHTRANVLRIRESRTKLTNQLTNLGFRVWPSQANFVMVRPPAGNARDLYEALKQRGILVRYFNEIALKDKLRISIGTDEENTILINVLKESVI